MSFSLTTYNLIMWFRFKVHENWHTFKKEKKVSFPSDKTMHDMGRHDQKPDDQMSSRNQISVLNIRLDSLRQCPLKKAGGASLKWDLTSLFHTLSGVFGG